MDISIPTSTFAQLVYKLNTEGTLYMLTEYLPCPTDAQKEEVLEVLNKYKDPCSTTPRYTFNQRNHTWEYI
jgi:hypothetical protein